jgi:hypothetical protein
MVQYAREQLEAVRSGPVDPFSIDAARAEARRMLKAIAGHNERGAAFVREMALAGMEGAHAALADLIEERNVRGEALGPALSTYAHNLLNRGRPPIRPPRGRPNENFLADLVIRYRCWICGCNSPACGSAGASVGDQAKRGDRPPAPSPPRP